MLLNINDLFDSFDGEVNAFHQGRYSTFIRFQGCNLNCPYCDTKDSIPMKNNFIASIRELLTKITTPKVTITGGEPLLQRAGFICLVNVLLDKGIKVTVETNGTFQLPRFWEDNPNFSWVMDFKCFLFRDDPTRTLTKQLVTNSKIVENMLLLQERDFLKIVVDKVEEDIDLINSFSLYFESLKCKIAVSPVMTDDSDLGRQKYKNVVKKLEIGVFSLYKTWILNTQLHKFLGVK